MCAERLCRGQQVKNWKKIVPNTQLSGVTGALQSILLMNSLSGKHLVYTLKILYTLNRAVAVCVSPDVSPSDVSEWIFQKTRYPFIIAHLAFGEGPLDSAPSVSFRPCDEFICF